MLDEKFYQDGDLDARRATPLIWKMIEALSSRLRPQPAAPAPEMEQARAGSPSIYKSARLR